MKNQTIYWHTNAEQDIDSDIYGEYQHRKYVDVVRNISTNEWSVLFFGKNVCSGFSSRSDAKKWAEDNVNSHPAN